MKPILLASLLAVGCVDSALPESDLDQNHDLDTSSLPGIRIPQTKEMQTGGMDKGSVPAVKLDRSHQSGLDLSGTYAAVGLTLDAKQATGIDASAITVADLVTFDHKSGFSGSNVDWAPLSQNWFATTSTGFGGRSCVVKSDSSVWCWGYNGEGGTNINPAKVLGLDGVVSISLTSDASCALRHDGAVWCWGNVGGTHVSHPMPISDLGLPTATAVAAGSNYFCAQADGGTYCWGGVFGSVATQAIVHQLDDHSAVAFARGEDLVFATVSLLK
jgi:hypothetical protein